MAKEEEAGLDEESQRRDQVVKGAIEGLLREYASELNAPSQDGENHPRNKKRKEKKEEVRTRPPVSLDQLGLARRGLPGPGPDLARPLCRALRHMGVSSDVFM